MVKTNRLLEEPENVTSLLGLDKSRAEVVLKPRLGLANRLRAIASARILSDITGSNFRYFWEINDDCAASDTTLFASLSEYAINAAEYAARKKRALVRTDSEIREQSNIINPQLVQKDRPLVIETCYQFRPETIPKEAFDHLIDRYLRDLKPSLRVEQRAVEIAGEKKYDIGIHIRRTDNVKSIGSSTDKEFTNVIDAILANCPKTTFYLATDCDATKQRFKERYGDRIQCVRIDYSRGTEQGITDAFAELLVLSRTSMILGSYHSSYSDIAAKIGGIPLRKGGVDSIDKILSGLPSQKADVASMAQEAKAARDAGEHNRSIRLYQALIRAEPKNPDYHYFIATVYTAQGNCPEARTHLNAVLSQCPGHSSARSLLERMGDKQ